MLGKLNLLESLANSVIQFDKLVKAILGTGVFLLRNLAKGKVVNAIHKTHLRQFVVVEDEILELLNFGFRGHDEGRKVDVC